MPIYWGDYLADTQHLTAEQHGMYLLLIAHYWQTGSLPADEKALRNISRCPARSWNRNWSIIRRFFVSIDSSRFAHPRIDAELEKSKKIRDVRAAAAASRWSQIDANASAPEMQVHTQSQSHTQKEKTKPLARPVFDWGTQDWADTEPMIPVWEEANPDIDVRQELAKARAWVINNPHKTRAGRKLWGKFLNGWMQRAGTDKPRAKKAQPGLDKASVFEGLA
jgi:uncharacterized protein YdaU (DUF1376 family)